MEEKPLLFNKNKLRVFMFHHLLGLLFLFQELQEVDIHILQIWDMDGLKDLFLRVQEIQADIMEMLMRIL